MRGELVATIVEQNKIIGLVMGSLPVAAAVYAVYVSNLRGTSPPGATDMPPAVAIPLTLLFLGSTMYSILALYMLHFYWNMRGLAAYLKGELLVRLEGNMRNVGGPEFENLEQPIRWEHRVSAHLDLPFALVPISWSAFIVPLLPATLLAWRGWNQVDRRTLPFERGLGYVAASLLAYGVLATIAVACGVGAHQKGTNPLRAFFRRLVEVARNARR